MTHLIRGLVAAVLLALVAAVAPASPASATGTNPPSILTPADGATVPYSWTGPLTVDFTDAPETSWDVVISCGLTSSVERFRTSATTTAETTTLSWNLPQRLPAATPCDVRVAEQVSGAYAATSSFGTGYAPLAAPGASVAPRTFYPRVVDGYADTTTVRYSLNRPAGVVIAVLDGSGKVVRTYRPGVLQPGNRRWSWNGRTDDRRIAPLGRYRLQITARAGGITRRSTSATVTLATKTVVVSRSVARWGDNGAPSTGGSCYITRSDYYGTADLDCWGGRFAQMRYSFAIPANARNIRWAVSGELTSADICCNGSVRRTGTRPSARRYAVTVRVTGWRAYEVARVRVTYGVPRVY